MSGSILSQGDVGALREAAGRLVTRLALTGYDNTSILQADAWIDTPEFRALWQQGSDALGYELGAYLGEAIIRRHGGQWTCGPRGPLVQVKRNGVHFIDPLGKVHKRVLHGSVDQLLALVNLVEHVASRPAIDAATVQRAALAALEEPRGEGGISALRFIAYAFVAMIAVPIVLLIALLFITDVTDALIGGACGVPLGLVVLVIALRRRPKVPTCAPGTLAFEAQLSLPPLKAKLADTLGAMRAQPSDQLLVEVVFYTTQVGELEAIVARRDSSPGRGYVGFDTHGTPTSSWSR